MYSGSATNSNERDCRPPTSCSYKKTSNCKVGVRLNLLSYEVHKSVFFCYSGYNKENAKKILRMFWGLFKSSR